MNPLAVFGPVIRSVADNVKMRVDAAALQTQARKARERIGAIDARVAAVAPKSFPWIPVLIGGAVILFFVMKRKAR